MENNATLYQLDFIEKLLKEKYASLTDFTHRRLDQLTVSEASELIKEIKEY